MYTDPPLTVAIAEGKTPETRIFTLDGPLTLSNLFVFQDALLNCEVPRVAIFDLSRVPYMDSAALGAIANYHVHCQRAGAELIVAGVNSRPMELFVLTKLHTA